MSLTSCLQDYLLKVYLKDHPQEINYMHKHREPLFNKHNHSRINQIRINNNKESKITNQITN